MIQQASFYFIRHGEADFLVNPHDEESAPLSERGKIQAHSLRPFVETLPIQTVCVSPLLRAMDTYQIAAGHLNCPFVVIEELRECNSNVWADMITLEGGVPLESLSESTQVFMHRAMTGINRALSFPGPVLIVAHGGIHFALCYHLNIQNHEKKVGNCVPVHFSHQQGLGWTALKY